VVRAKTNWLGIRIVCPSGISLRMSWKICIIYQRKTMHLITHNTRKYKISSKKSLRIPKGYSETVNLTDNIMAEMKNQSLCSSVNIVCHSSVMTLHWAANKCTSNTMGVTNEQKLITVSQHLR
jgi:hypothetical protein